MDNLNENLNGMEKPAGCFHRFSKTIKWWLLPYWYCCC